MAEYYKLELVSIEDVAKEIRRFNFKPNEKFEFKPGNYVLMFNNKNSKVAGLSRPFTIVSTPDDDLISFIIKKVGVFTTELFNLKPGDTLDIEAPHGNMYFEEEIKNIIFIAGGTGITPFICMQKHVKEKNIMINFKLFYSVKKEDEIIYKGLLEQYESMIVVSSAGKRIDELFLKENIKTSELENHDIFICGPPRMEDSIYEILKKMGAKHLHVER